jgi:hypothetical protein
MRNFIAVVFGDMSRAYEGLHGLWQLDSAGEITVHGTAVVHRDALGQFRVDTKDLGRSRERTRVCSPRGTHPRRSGRGEGGGRAG